VGGLWAGGWGRAGFSWAGWALLPRAKVVNPKSSPETFGFPTGGPVAFFLRLGSIPRPFRPAWPPVPPAGNRLAAQVFRGEQAY